jgi:hypothetical protein
MNYTLDSNDTTDLATTFSTSPDALVEEMSNGVPVTYACEYQTGNDPLATNTFDVVTVEQFYDFVYPCYQDKQEGANYIAEQLLMKAAVAWNILPNGEACTAPQSVYGAWLFGVSSEGPDEFISDFGCQRLTPNITKKECCQVVRSEMKFIPTGGYNKTVLQQFVQDQLDAKEPSYSLLFRTASINPIFNETIPINDASGNLSEPTRVASGVQGQVTEKSANREKVTATGGFVIALLSAAFVGFFVILYRRNRKPRASAGDTFHKDDDFCNSTMEQGPSCEGDYHVTILSEDASSSFLRQHTSFDLEEDQNFVDMPLEEAPPAKYAFDLGESFKNDVMGTYAPTTMQVVAPYPMMEDTSCDSEADSWAQTDGTVGSLEERLEEITAEI